MASQTAGNELYKGLYRIYEICRCCGLRIIPSGSRWSLFYCQVCKLRIRNLNETIERCIIPCGRHSIMSVSLSGQNPKSIEAVAEFILSV